jgi:hypothetical protein
MGSACMTTVTLMTIGATSTGGVTALVVKKRRAKNSVRTTDPTTQTGKLDKVHRKETNR